MKVSNGTASFKNVNNCWNIKFYFYLETSGTYVIKRFTAVMDHLQLRISHAISY